MAEYRTTRQGILRSVVEESEADWIERRFRLSSSGYCEQDYMEISEEVLRESLPLFAPRLDSAGIESHLLVMANHQHSADAWLGRVMAAEYMDANERMPSGIDGILRLYRDSDPRIVTGVERGIITAVSIGFTAEGHLSYDGGDNEYPVMLGAESPDGTIQRIIVDRITEVYEVSIVWRGADPTALSLQRSENTAKSEPIEAIENRKVEETVIMDMAKLIEVLGLAEEATPEDVLAAIEALKPSEDAPEVDSNPEDSSELDEMRAALEASELALRSLRASVLVDGAIASGKIQADKRDNLVARAISDYEAVQETLEMIAVVATRTAPQGVVAPHTVADSKPAAIPLTAAQKSVMRQLGLSEEALRKTIQ